MELEGHNDDMTGEMFDVIDEEEPNTLLEESIRTNPFQNRFAEMKAEMTPISEFIHKKIISAGSTLVPEQSQVEIHYNAYLEESSNAFDSTYNHKSLKFIRGDSGVLPGIQEAVATMKRHEESQFIISWKRLFGALGCPPRVPGKTDALFVVRLIDFREIVMPSLVDGVEMSEFMRKYQHAILQKTKGAEKFKRGDYASATNDYKSAVRDVEICNLKDEEEENLRKDILEKLYLNLAMCYNRQQQPKMACNMINNLKVLQPIYKNPKALYQEAKALIEFGEYDRALNNLKSAQKLEPNNREIMVAIGNLLERKEKYTAAERAFSQRGLGIVTKVNDDKENAKADKTLQALREIAENFMKSNERTLMVPAKLTDADLQCLKKLEKEFDFQVEVVSLTTGNEYKLRKTPLTDSNSSVRLENRMN